MAEESLHDSNCFITLTYSPENLPKYGNLEKSDFQKFMKRFREWLAREAKKGKKTPPDIKYFYCGEYGDENGRPHFHAIIFDYNFQNPEKIPRWQGLSKGVKHLSHDPINNTDLYSSEDLSRLWGLGHASVGTVTYESAHYVARYITKKKFGPLADKYEIIDPDTGEIFQKQKEYADMSRQKPIGLEWYKLYKKDLLADDFVVVKTLKGMQKIPMPRYFDKKIELENEHHFKRIKAARKQKALDNKHDNTLQRLNDKRQVKLAQIKNITRGLK